MLRDSYRNADFFISAKGIHLYEEPIGTLLLKKIVYDNYRGRFFLENKKAIYHAKLVLFENGGCWLVQ